MMVVMRGVSMCAHMCVCVCVCVCIQSSLKWDHLAGHFLMGSVQILIGLPRWVSGKESTCQCRKHRRCGFNPWVWKIPWRRTWQLTPVFLPGKSRGQGAWRATVHRVSKSQTRLSDWAHTHTDLQILLSSLDEGGHYRTCLVLQSLLRTKSFFKITKYLFLPMPAVLQNKSWSLS